MTIDVINPATGELIKSYELMSQQTVTGIIDSMADVRRSWQDTSFSERHLLFLRMADILRRDCRDFAKIITGEMGKPFKQAKNEIEKCAWLCEYYVENAEEHLQPQVIETEHKKSYTCYEPLGIVFAVMPWNYPIWQVMRFAVPNIMGGNAGLLKHAPNSMGAALAIEKLFIDAGFPHGLFRSVVADVDVVPAIIAHPEVTGITLTGSEGAGAAVASEAGKQLKKVVLELGGSDPYIICEDADIEVAVDACVKSRYLNAGQVCIAAKRILVLDGIYDAFMERLLEEAKQYTCGDPMDEATMMGPMARADLRDTLHRQVSESIQAGASCLLGGEMPEGPGCYYPATLLADIPEGCPASTQELFGPVITVWRVSDMDEAVNIANETAYGLSAGIFTTNLEEGERIAKDLLRAGTVSVNACVSSDPRLPFGGIKRSGYGREMASAGIREFMNLKTVVVD